MSSLPRLLSYLRGHVRLRAILLVLIAGALGVAAAPPAWWQARGVLKAGAVADDYAAINQGQLKNLLKATVQQLDSTLPDGAGDALFEMIAGMATPTEKTDDYAAVTIGQLKASAARVYDRLWELGYVNRYPWDPAPNGKEPDDYALANIGQAKSLFAIDLTRDTNSVGIPDWWRAKYGLQFPNVAATLALAPGGITFLKKFQLGLDPTVEDSDGDGYGDGVEIAAGANPNDRAEDPTNHLGHGAVPFVLESRMATTIENIGGNIDYDGTIYPGTPTVVGVSVSNSRMEAVPEPPFMYPSADMWSGSGEYTFTDYISGGGGIPISSADFGDIAYKWVTIETAHLTEDVRKRYAYGVNLGETKATNILSFESRFVFWIRTDNGKPAAEDITQVYLKATKDLPSQQNPMPIPTFQTVQLTIPKGKVTSSTFESITAPYGKTVSLLPVEMRITDRDDPKKKWTDNVVKTAPVYSGKTTGDMVSWKLGGTDSWTNATFSWSAEGPETKTGPSGTGKNEWKIADGDEDAANDWIKWKPGKYKIKCAISFAGGGSSNVEFKQEVGVRTDDVVVVGWIDPAQVTLNTSGVQSALTQVFPSGGLAASDASMAKQQAGFLLKHISEDGVSAGFELVPLYLRFAVTNVSFNAFSAADKAYALNWMFKYAGNSPPQNSFTTNGHFDQQLLDDFVDGHDSTDFKLMNHYQAKYRVNENGKFIIEPGKTRVGEVKSKALIGNTKDPSRLYDVVDSLPDAVLRFLGYPPKGVFQGQPSDKNTQFTIVDTGRTTTRLLNEGRPDQKALDAFFKLTGQDQGYIWSSITFFPDLQYYSETISPSTGQSLTRDPKPSEFSQGRINTQVYPTYWFYINGVKSDKVQNQASSPSALFPNTDRAQ